MLSLILGKVNSFDEKLGNYKDTQTVLQRGHAARNWGSSSASTNLLVMLLGHLGSIPISLSQAFK